MARTVVNRTPRRVARAAVEAVEARVLLAGDPVISEFMAINSHTLRDADGEYSDWIEIHNRAAAPVSLGGWYLTDDDDAKTKWRFPAVSVAPGGRLVVFASDKDRTNPAAQLHTNFKLDGDGEYLALVKPDGSTVASAFDPFPSQAPDVSYGAGPDQTFGFFTTPTPGQANSSAPLNTGPAIDDVAHAPALRADADPITVTARVTPRSAAVGAVTLTYRVMFGAQVPLAMLDDGAHGEGAAGDGVYGAVIPASASTPGQMVRYAVTASDASGRVSRAPLHATVESPEYFGTVIRNPAVDASTLPVFQFFALEPSRVTTRGGTRVAVSYGGEFYDSVFVRDRGAGTTDGLKFDFNPGAHFRWEPDTPRVDEINLNYRSFDETYVRAPLAFETFRDAGEPAITAFPIRIQQNNAFWRVADFVENVDAEFLERVGLDGDGALYKLTTSSAQLTNAGVFEKKTRKHESHADLQAFLNGIHQTGQAQVNYLFDHFDVPGFLSYWAANTIVNDSDNAQKNYYLYRDTEGDGRWRFIAYDKDLTFGKHWGVADYQARDPLTHPFFGDSNHPEIDGAYAWNFLIDALLDIPLVKQMYVRRLRTVMDELLQPPGTPVAQRKFEARLDQLYARLSGDPAASAALPSLRQRIDDIKNRYLEPRRTHLYVNHSANAGYPDHAGIPAAQPASFAIRIGAIEVNPASGDQGQEYIQITNPNAFHADVSGWRLEDAVDYVLPGGTVVPAGGAVYVAANVADFRARTSGPRGNQGLLVVGGYDGQLSARGETIVLKNAAGALVDSLTYAASPTAAQQALRVTEVMYNPAAPPPGGASADAQDYEFIEIQNISAQSLNLNAMKFTQGVNFTFGNVTLAPGAYAVLARNRAAFTSRYGSAAAAAVAGEFAPDHLDNMGERIRLEDAVGEVVLDFSYSPSWQPATDGGGRSLVIKNPAGSVGGWGDAAAWRPSGAEGGSPGAADAADLTAPAVASAQLDPAGPNHRVRVTFTEPVTVASASALTVSGVGPARAATSVTYDNVTRTATFTFTGTLPNGNYTAALSPAGVADSASNAMTAGHSFAFFALAGDVNRDRSVNGTDFALLARSFGRTGMSFAQGDLTGDGAVNGSDFAILAGNFGRTVPAPAGLAEAVALPPAPLDAASPAPAPATAPAAARRRVVPPPASTTPPARRTLARRQSPFAAFRKL